MTSPLPTGLLKNGDWLARESVFPAIISYRASQVSLIHHARRLVALSLILLTGCSSSGFFNGRSSRGKEGVAQAFDSQREAARDERPSQPWRRADAPVAKTPTAPVSSPTDSRQKLQIAEALAEAGRADRANDSAGARAAYERVVTIEPAHAFANYQLAVIADNEGRFTEAERYYQTLLRKSPRNADLLASLGWSYLLQGRYEESERTLREALSVDSKHRTAMYNLGWLYGTLGDYDQSLAIFRAAGSEEDAQRAVAELFPRGRPAVSTQLASGLPKNPFVAESNGSAGGRGRNDNQFASGPLSAPAPSQRNAANSLAGGLRAQPASVPRGKPTQEATEFDAAFAQLEGAAPATGSPPRIGGVIQAGGTDQQLTPPPDHDMPVITPRAGSPATPGDKRAPGASDGHAALPVVGELTATRSANPRGNSQALPDWTDHSFSSGNSAASGGRKPQTVAAQVGLSAGPGGLPFPLFSAPAAPPALTRNSQNSPGNYDRAWADQRTADRLPRW